MVLLMVNFFFFGDILMSVDSDLLVCLHRNSQPLFSALLCPIPPPVPNSELITP